MSDIIVTAVGWAATEPRPIKSDASVPYTDFRIAHSSRRHDGERWVDGNTVWFTVKAFRDLARNITESVHKGLPVLVQGRLRTETWTGKDGQERSANVIDATAVGLNLARGASTFGRRDHRPSEETDAVGPAGAEGEAASVPPTETDPLGEHDEDPWATDGPALRVEEADATEQVDAIEEVVGVGA